MTSSNWNRKVRTAARAVPRPRAGADGRRASVRGDRRWPAPSRPRERADHADPRRPGGEDRGDRADRPASTSADVRIVDAPHSHAAAAKAVELVRDGRGRAADEGQPAHRRAARRRRRARDGPAHRPPHQPRVHHGRADLPQGPDRHRRGDQHRADARGQGRHLPERDRPRASRSASSAPKVAILAAVETVTSKMPATIDAAALCKMAERGQITGGAARRPAGVRQRDQHGGGAGSRASPRRSRAIPTSCSRRISRRATSSPSSSASWPTPTAPAWCSARACRSS